MGFLSATLSMLCLGVSTYLYKKCSPTLGTTNTTFFYYAFGFLIAALVWVFAREKTSYQSKDLIWPFLTALSLFVSIWTFNYALQFIPMSIAAPIRGMSFLVAVFLAVIFSGEKICTKDFVAIGLVVAALAVFSSAEAERRQLSDRMGAKPAEQTMPAENRRSEL